EVIRLDPFDRGGRDARRAGDLLQAHRSLLARTLQIAADRVHPTSLSVVCDSGTATATTTATARAPDAARGPRTSLRTSKLRGAALPDTCRARDVAAPLQGAARFGALPL